MNTPEQRTKRHLELSIDHCLYVIALCESNGHMKAAASYEEQLQRLREELQELEQQLKLEEAMRVSMEHKEVEGMKL